jgi:hypothetical protein
VNKLALLGHTYKNNGTDEINLVSE